MRFPVRCFDWPSPDFDCGMLDVLIMPASLFEVPVNSVLDSEAADVPDYALPDYGLLHAKLGSIPMSMFTPLGTTGTGRYFDWAHTPQVGNLGPFAQRRPPGHRSQVTLCAGCQTTKASNRGPIMEKMTQQAPSLWTAKQVFKRIRARFRQATENVSKKAGL